MKKILAIAAGQETSRKGESTVRKKLKYLNFGLLGLVTLIDRYSDREIVMFQADAFSVEELIAEIEATGLDLIRDCDCVLLSIPSYHSISWCAKFCEYMKKNYGLKIIVGGRWVVDNHSAWIKEKLKYVDIVSEGFGERFAAEHFDFCGDKQLFCGEKNCFPFVDYTLLHNYQEYHPNIEISRGCGSGCHFCADRNTPRLPDKSVELVMNELNFLDRIYNDYTVYLTAPHFVFDPKWIDLFHGMMLNRNYQIPWRCTSRVESIPLNQLGVLRESGLKIIDVGLESASPTQLTRMHKTANPQKYLERASALLKACKENGIWVKLNILLYAGETTETVHETMRWLLLHKNYIKDISAGSLVYYHNMDNLSELEQLGASIAEGDDFQDNGFAILNLSPDISKERAAQLCREIPQLIANQRDFYDMKSFSYYPSSYSYEQFLQDAKSCDPNDLPFYIDE